MGHAKNVGLVCLMVVIMVMIRVVESQHDYGDALTKSILFFEGQRSGRLPSTQRVTWRKSSALRDGLDQGVDLVGGYYDAGDNVKYNFPMSFTMVLLAWSVVDFGQFMAEERQHALEAVRWGTDFLLKSTARPGKVFVQVGNAQLDHNCWQRPEDMDTPRTTFVIDEQHPGSEVSSEIAAALAASSVAFKSLDPNYSKLLLNRAISVFEFADRFQGSYNDNLRDFVCPFYCDYSGYNDELVWAATWLYRATNSPYYLNYVKANLYKLGNTIDQFDWDAKFAGIHVLASQLVGSNMPESSTFVPKADAFVCSVLPESPTRTVTYSPGGLLFRPGGANMQNPTALGFLLLSYAQHLKNLNRNVICGNVVASPDKLIALVKSQVDYILGDNPMKMSYMVGYGQSYPQKIHHRGSVLPSVVDHPEHIVCQGGRDYFFSPNPNPNVLVGALVGGPYENDTYWDSRTEPSQTEPCTYINAPFVGILAYFKAFPSL